MTLSDLPLPWTLGLGGALVSVVVTWLRFVLLAQAAARRQQEAWDDIATRLDAEIARKDAEIERLRAELWNRRTEP